MLNDKLRDIKENIPKEVIPKLIVIRNTMQFMMDGEEMDERNKLQYHTKQFEQQIAAFMS